MLKWGTSSSHNQIMNCFHLVGHWECPSSYLDRISCALNSTTAGGACTTKRKLTTPTLPLKATENHACTQDPNALHLPCLPDHPLTL